MNSKNLDYLQTEMRTIGFSEKLITLMEEQMRNDPPHFKLYESTLADKGSIDLTLHFKQANNSDNYYLSRFDTVKNALEPLPEGSQYTVFHNTPGPEKNTFTHFGNIGEALEAFKILDGDHVLGITKGDKLDQMLATMKKGGVSVDTDFKGVFYDRPSQPQNFWVEKKGGFSVRQAINLMQGRAVHRDNLLDKDFNQWKAWMQFDYTLPRDKFQNITFERFGDPAYGFNIQKVLEKYQIKELKDPAKIAEIETSFKQGDRVLVTAVKDGQENKVFIEASVRYHSLDFFDRNGTSLNHKEFMKSIPKEQRFTKGNGKEKDMTTSQELSR